MPNQPDRCRHEAVSPWACAVADPALITTRGDPVDTTGVEYLCAGSDLLTARLDAKLHTEACISEQGYLDAQLVCNPEPAAGTLVVSALREQPREWIDGTGTFVVYIDDDVMIAGPEADCDRRNTVEDRVGDRFTDGEDQVVKLISTCERRDPSGRLAGGSRRRVGDLQIRRPMREGIRLRRKKVR